MSQMWRCWCEGGRYEQARDGVCRKNFVTGWDGSLARLGSGGGAGQIVEIRFASASVTNQSIWVRGCDRHVFDRLTWRSGKKGRKGWGQKDCSAGTVVLWGKKTGRNGGKEDDPLSRNCFGCGQEIIGANDARYGGCLGLAALRPHRASAAQRPQQWSLVHDSACQPAPATSSSRCRDCVFPQPEALLKLGPSAMAGRWGRQAAMIPMMLTASTVKFQTLLITYQTPVNSLREWRMTRDSTRFELLPPATLWSRDELLDL